MSRIVITIPTWNEALVIERTLRLLREQATQLLTGHLVRIEVADNGSTDDTREIVRRLDGVMLLQLAERGKGRSIRHSWSWHAQEAAVLVFMDADLAADLSALPALIEPILKNQADLVCGSRFVRGARLERTWVREAASWTYRVLQRLILRLPVKDAQCGFKALSASAARILLPLCRENGWLFDTELIAQAAAHSLRVTEIPVTWIERRTPERRSAINVFRDGWGFVKGLFRIRKHVRKGAG